MAASKRTAAKKPGARSSAKTPATASKTAESAAKKTAKIQAQGESTSSASTAVDEQLARYRSMRDFHVTAEPSGADKAALEPERKAAAQYPFCIQKHAASHLHYDFRLGWNGVLKSWAVAKGPSYVTADKRLAVQVEDHPMEYGGFEGIIPKGQYGGGTVMLWDQGTWEPQAAYPDVDAGLRDGSLKFILHGTKLKGKWALIRMKPRPKETKPTWLLIKEHDPFERAPSDPSVTEEETNSVVTGRSLEQIAASEDHVWNSKETAKPGQAWYRQESKSGSPPGELQPASQSTAPQPATRTLQPSLTTLPKESQPTFLKPQLADHAEIPPSSGDWMHELKLDGYRIQARKDKNQVQLFTRTGLDWTHRMADLAAEIARLPIASATLDGEVVVLSPDGTTSFANLQAAFQNDARHHLTYFAFDLLHLDGRNPRDLPLRERKSLLGELIANADPQTLRLSEHLESDGPRIFREACKMRAEGIVSKRASAKYCAGRSSDWLKCKCLHEQEFVIGGFTLPAAGHTGMRGIGALLLGYYRPAEAGNPAKLIYAGRTGTGFTVKTHKLLRDQLEALAQPATPFEKPPAEARRGAHWVAPTLVAQVRFATWTADNLVRQAAFLGLREDKPAGEVTREDAAPTPRSSKNSASGVSPSANGGKDVSRERPQPTASDPQSSTPKIRLTHPQKILDPESHLTKQQLADYYWAIAPFMLPHVANRPLSLVRCPEGSSKQCFFQKHVNAMLPKSVGSVDVPDKKTGAIEPYITLNDPRTNPETLTSLAQLGVLEIHPWGSSNADLEHPDRLIFDLDPDESLPWSTVTEAAAEVRGRLKKLGLASFLKTTGGKGLHVVIPIAPALDWAAAKSFAHAFVLAMEKANPRLYLTRMSKAARTGKIYLDYLRNERGATAVAPYSPRARAGAGVSMPLAWAEIAATGDFATMRPTFSVAGFAEWRGRLQKDPWKAISSTSQSITAETFATLGVKASA
jgi:bifunctional non-homologous end joining protein LigD